MGLEKYKLDKAFTAGVEIRLDDAPDVVFLVRLPSQYNRSYSQALYSAMDWSVSDDGKIKAGGNLMVTRYAQEDAFMAHCLLSMDGEPIPKDFQSEYPTAVAELMVKSAEIANELDEKVSADAKKSSASSIGNESGQVEKGSTSDLKKAAG